MFGYEEMVEGFHKRRMRATALEKTICLYLNKENFDEVCDRVDHEEFKEMMKLYTNYTEEGEELLREV